MSKDDLYIDKVFDADADNNADAEAAIKQSSANLVARAAQNTVLDVIEVLENCRLMEAAQTIRYWHTRKMLKQHGDDALPMVREMFKLSKDVPKM